MAGRWKVGSDGQPQWEEGVNAPNQIEPPPGAQPGQVQNQASPWDPNKQGQSNPWPSQPQTQQSGGSQLYDPARSQNQSSPQYAAPRQGVSGPIVDDNGQPTDPYEPPPPSGPIGDVGPWPEIPNPKGPPLPPTNDGRQKPTTGAPPGFDQDKWNDPALGTSNKYIVGRILAAGGSIQQAAAAVGARVISPDVIEFPDGTRIDVFFDNDNASGQRRVQYTDVTGAGSGGGSTTSAAASTAPYGTAGQPNSGGLPSGARTISGLMTSPSSTQASWDSFLPSSQAPGTYLNGQVTSVQPPAPNTPSNPLALPTVQTDGIPTNDPRRDPLLDALWERAMRSPEVRADDPIIQAQVNAFRAEQDRGSRNYVASLAEKRGPQANLQGEARLANERASQATGNMQAQLMAQELNARRQEILQYFQLYGATLTQGQQLALQRELGLIDAQLRQLSIVNQNNQFLSDLSLRAEDRASYWDALRRGLL